MYNPFANPRVPEWIKWAAIIGIGAGSAIAAVRVLDPRVDAVVLQNRLFYFGLALMVLNTVVTVPLAALHRRLETRRPKPPPKDESLRYPPITVIIPAYNEAANIESTIQSVYRAEYPGRKEIIVVDDGSTDRTSEIAEPYVERGWIDLIRRENGGKPAAINLALLSSSGEYVFVIDGDGILDPKAFIKMVDKFHSPRVGAVAGNIQVGNPRFFIQKLQMLEYIRDINITRRAYRLLNMVMIVPGPLGAFRRSLLQGIGTYDMDTKTEDFDLTLKAQKAGAVIEVCQDALAFTEAPRTRRDLFNQRKRWYGGMFQTLSKHADLVFLGFIKFGNVGRFGGWYTLFSLTFIPFMELQVFAIFLLYLASGRIGVVLYPFMVLTWMETVLSFWALKMDGKPGRCALLAVPFNLGYRQYLALIKVYMFFKVVIFRERLSWSRPRKYGIGGDSLPAGGKDVDHVPEFVSNAV